jgi:hypothetical protein
MTVARVDGSERGLALLECAAALAIAGLVLLSTAEVSRASATIVRRARLQAEALDVVRGLLEHELGAPCGAPPPCPAGWRCRVTRAALSAAADHLTASAEREDGQAAEEMATLAPAPACRS